MGSAQRLALLQPHQTFARRNNRPASPQGKERAVDLASKQKPHSMRSAAIARYTRPAEAPLAKGGIQNAFARIVSRKENASVSSAHPVPRLRHQSRQPCAVRNQLQRARDSNALSPSGEIKTTRAVLRLHENAPVSAREVAEEAVRSLHR